jgi:hypothetical protein
MHRTKPDFSFARLKLTEAERMALSAQLEERVAQRLAKAPTPALPLFVRHR